MGPSYRLFQDEWDDGALTLSPTKPSYTEATAVAEEDWLKVQAEMLKKAGESRLAEFAEHLQNALSAQLKTYERNKALTLLNDFILKSREAGGYNGHLPNPLKRRPKLRIAIWNLYVRAYGPNTFYGRIFAPKTSEDVKIPSYAETNGHFRMPNQTGLPRSTDARGRRP